MNKEEATAYAYREAGKAVAAYALNDDHAVCLKSKDPAAKCRANEIDATVSLAGPYAHLKLDPSTDIAQVQGNEWAADILRAHGRVADSVLCKSRPDEPWPEPSGGAIMLEFDEAMEAMSTMARLNDDAKALVADRWFAINSVADVLMERGEISGDEIAAIVRTHVGQAS